MKKKILALFLCLSLLIVPFGTISVSAGTPGTPTTYEVVTADDLIDAIAEINDSGDTSANITLKANIDLTEKEFTPLTTYSGTFDGGDKTITGLTKPLITAGTACTVQNLTVDGAYVTDGGHVGALIAAATNVTINNCTIMG